MKHRQNKYRRAFIVQPAGAFIAIDPRNGHVEAVLVQAGDDQQQAVIQGTLARIIRPGAYGWLRRLIRG